MSGGVTWPLVGRDEELAVIGELLDGGARGVVIAGVAGAGKTRLTSEVLTVARKRGFSTERVVGSHSASTIPLGAFAPLLSAGYGEVAGTLEGLQWATDALVDKAEGGRLVLVVDDGHDLDSASATLVHQLALRAPVFVVVTVRSGEAAPDAVVALWKDGLAPRLELQELSREETTALVELVLSGPIDAPSAHRLWITSGGNPLFLRELLITGLDAGTLDEEGGVWTLRGAVHVSESIHDLVRQRLAGIAPAENQVLLMLAGADVVGLKMLRAMHRHADLEMLEQRQLIRVDDDGRRRPVSLNHPLYGEVLRAGAPRTSTVTLARRLTAEVERLGARRREDPLRVGTWTLVTGGEAPTGLLATAAQQAYYAADFELAERLARAALASGPQPVTAVLLAQLLDERGRHDETEALLESVHLNDLPPPLRTRAALVRADNLFFGLGREPEAQAVLLEAERDFPDASTGELVADRAWFDVYAGRPRMALVRLRVVGSTDTRGHVAACIVAAWALALLGDTAGALQAAGEAAVGERPLTYPAISRHQDFPEMAKALALLQAGRLYEAEQVARIGLGGSLTGCPAFLHARWQALFGGVAAERGLMRTAAAAYRQAGALQRGLAQAGLLRSNLAGEAQAAAQAGAVTQAAAAMAELKRLPATPERLFDAEVGSAEAWLAAARGERSKAVRLLKEAAAAASRSELVTVEIRIQHDLVRLGEVRDAAARLAYLAQITDSTTAPVKAGHAAARVDGSGERLEEAAAALEQSGLLLLAAEAFTHAAVAHASAGRRHTQACLRRAASLFEACENVRTPAAIAEPTVAALTPREREVVTMAASGTLSRVIAERLIISVRTVDNLIQRAYIKLGVHSREQAAAVLNLPPAETARTSRILG